MTNRKLTISCPKTHMPEVPCDCGANTALETIATYTNGGQTFEIDHLGIGFADTQWGEFVVYRDGRQIAEFAIEESALKPEFRPAELPVTTDELIRLAREAVAIEEAADILDG